MADNYILNIKPTISASDGRKLESDLNSRFSRVAKKFGGALRTVGSAFKGLVVGSLFAGIGAIGAMMTNPIEKINQSLNNTLQKADNIATRAGQIGTTSGKLLQVQAVAESAGVQNFDMIISRFQTELGRSRSGESDTLKEFAGEKDTLEAFIKVIDSIKTLSPSEQNLMISKIFGERANIQLAEFMQADLMQRRNQIFGGLTEEQLTKAVNRIGEKEDLQSILAQQTAVSDLMTKSRMISEETIRLQNEYYKTQLRTENAQFSQYSSFVRMATAAEESKAILAEIQEDITPLVEKGVGILENSYNWLASSKFGKWAGGVFK